MSDERPSGNGILARVPSEFVGRASHALPDAATAPDEQVSVEVDAGWVGRVRLTFVKFRYSRPKGKFSATAWSCKHAEHVVADPGGDASCGRGVGEIGGGST